FGRRIARGRGVWVGPVRIHVAQRVVARVAIEVGAVDVAGGIGARPAPEPGGIVAEAERVEAGLLVAFLAEVAVTALADAGRRGRGPPGGRAERVVLLVREDRAGLVELGRDRAEVVGELEAEARGWRERRDARIHGLRLDERDE